MHSNSTSPTKWRCPYWRQQYGREGLVNADRREKMYDCSGIWGGSKRMLMIEVIAVSKWEWRRRGNCRGIGRVARRICEDCVYQHQPHLMQIENLVGVKTSAVSRDTSQPTKCWQAPWWNTRDGVHKQRVLKSINGAQPCIIFAHPSSTRTF